MGDQMGDYLPCKSVAMKVIFLILLKENDNFGYICLTEIFFGLLHRRPQDSRRADWTLHANLIKAKNPLLIWLLHCGI